MNGVGRNSIGSWLALVTLFPLFSIKTKSSVARLSFWPGGSWGARSSLGSDWTHWPHGPGAAGRALETNQPRLSQFAPVSVSVLSGQCIWFAFLALGSLGPECAGEAVRAGGALWAGVTPGPIAAVVARPSPGPALARVPRNSVGSGESRNASGAHVSFRSWRPGSSSLTLVTFAALKPREPLQSWGPAEAWRACWSREAAASFFGVAPAATAAVSPSAGPVELLHTRQDAVGQEPRCHGGQQQPPARHRVHGESAGAAGAAPSLLILARRQGRPGARRRGLGTRAPL